MLNKTCIKHTHMKKSNNTKCNSKTKEKTKHKTKHTTMDNDREQCQEQARPWTLQQLPHSRAARSSRRVYEIHHIPPVWLQLVNNTHMSNVALHSSLNSASPQHRIRRHPFQANVACDFESGALSRKHTLNPEDAIPTKETWSEVQDEAGSGYACLIAGYTTLCRQTFTRGGDRIKLKSEQSMDSHQFFADACGAMYLCRVNPTHTISVPMDGLSEDI